MARYINPKTDFAFKKIFGSEQSHDVLISFLNALLYNGDPTIQALDILNPYQAPRIRGVKDTYLDVKAQLSTGETVIIEMQVLNVEGFEQRILYNAAKAYSIQLGIGDSYDLLNPVIALTITDFEMFPEMETVMTHFVLKEKYFLMDYPTHDLELIFIELPKFQRQLNQLSSLSDLWLYFLQNAPQFDRIPPEMQGVSAIEEAFNFANQANLTHEELEEFEHQQMFIHDQRNMLTKATKEGLARGLALGIAEGRVEGRVEGRAEGRAEGQAEGIEAGSRQTQLAIAQRMLMTADNETISQLTGLSVEEIQQLRNA
jgi:predicted transposase/invertase (TIGR01784 family)